jgi:hypothetical protein
VIRKEPNLDVALRRVQSRESLVGHWGDSSRSVR